jgi:hypothetical protein
LNDGFLCNLCTTESYALAQSIAPQKAMRWHCTTESYALAQSIAPQKAMRWHSTTESYALAQSIAPQKAMRWLHQKQRNGNFRRQWKIRISHC